MDISIWGSVQRSNQRSDREFQCNDSAILIQPHLCTSTFPLLGRGGSPIYVSLAHLFFASAFLYWLSLRAPPPWAISGWRHDCHHRNFLSAGIRYPIQTNWGWSDEWLDDENWEEPRGLLVGRRQLRSGEREGRLMRTAFLHEANQ